jgi:hypothetical protein
MHYVTIRQHLAAGLVTVEAYNTDTDGVSGATISTQDVWRWLWDRRPCQVLLRGRTYWLEHPEACTERLVPWF